MRRPLGILTAALAAALAGAGPAGAIEIYLSTQSGETLAGVPMTNGDVVRYDTSTGTATEIYNENFDSGPEDVDAFELLPNGLMVFSTFQSAILAGTFFENGDLVEYDPVNHIANIIFPESRFAGPVGPPNIDAVAVLPNGNILLSTDATESLPGLPNFSDGDIVEWDGNSASRFLAETFFGVDVNVDAFDLDLSNGIYAFSFSQDATIRGLPVDNGDVLFYDINTDTFTIPLFETSFSTAPADVDAVAIPEPSTATLLALGLFGLALAGRHRRT